jgi:hypothetical protein
MSLEMPVEYGNVKRITHGVFSLKSRLIRTTLFVKPSGFYVSPFFLLEQLRILAKASTA